ncbi:MAG: CHAT domain-containing protein [Pontixanthobacter sp.]
MKRYCWITTTLLTLSACGQAGDPPHLPQPAAVVSADAVAPLERTRFADLPPAVQIDFQTPSEVDQQIKAELLDAIAGSRNYSDIIRQNARRGGVEAARTERDLPRARRDLVAISNNLKSLSSTGTQTYVLIHTAERGQPLKAWLISPDGKIVYDQSAEPYTNLDGVSEGLGVKRISASRQPRAKDEPLPTDAEIAKAEAADKTAKSVALRKATLTRTANTLLPGKVAQALGTRSGRLLIIPAFDTGTAPYAALPLANGYAGENWSLVVVPGIEGLVSGDGAFDFGALDISKAVVFGDPDLSDDPSWNWAKLKGARAEALATADTLGIPVTQVMIGKDATRPAFEKAMKARSDIGLVYIASHAVSNPQNPLTKGYIAMRGGHYFAGEIRGENVPGWPIVVLSACQTGLGGTLQGGHFGVAQAWMTAGAGQVVASLWNVSDTATKILMGHFVDHLKAGEAPEFAMQKAQVETLNYRAADGTYPYAEDPKKWASFTIFGLPSINSAP